MSEFNLMSLTAAYFLFELNVLTNIIIDEVHTVLINEPEYAFKLLGGYI